MGDGLISFSEEKLARNSFRLVLPDVDGMVRPIATVGVVKEGSVWISPVAAAGMEWCYGLVRPMAAPIQLAVAQEPPKIIWHQSGEVHVSLSGTRLERTAGQWSAPGSNPGQRISLFASFPLALTTSKPIRARDTILLERRPGLEQRAPHAVGVSLRLTPFGEVDRYVAGNGPVGLVEGTANEFVLSLAAYGVPLALRGSLVWDSHSSPAPAPGVCIGAYEAKDVAIAVWSNSLLNPVLL